MPLLGFAQQPLNGLVGVDFNLAQRVEIGFVVIDIKKRASVADEPKLSGLGRIPEG